MRCGQHYVEAAIAVEDVNSDPGIGSFVGP